MIAFLAKIFIKDSENYGYARVRGGYGVLIGAFFIVLNHDFSSKSVAEPFLAQSPLGMV